VQQRCDSACRRGAALSRSCSLIRRATRPGTPAEREWKLAGRAAHDFTKGARIATRSGAKGKLEAACASALTALLDDGNRRAVIFRDAERTTR
jgi:hypothetical protein